MPANQYDYSKLSDAELVQVDKHIRRVKCLTDLYYLSTEILGYVDASPSFHKPLCDLISSVNHLLIQQAGDSCPLTKLNSILSTGYSADEVGGLGGGGVNWVTSTKNRIKFPEELQRIAPYVKYDPEALERLWLLFRGSFKTTLITVAHSVQCLLLWPNIRMLITSHKKEGGSDKILGGIKHHFMFNAKLRHLFPEYCPKPNGVGVVEWGTTETCKLPNRSSDCAWLEGSIDIAGHTTDMTGRHYDYIKNDDLVTKDSVGTETMIQKTREFKSLQKYLFNQPEWGITDNVGTIYHFNDLHSNMMKQSGITKTIVPVWITEQSSSNFHEPLLPERFTKEGIQRIKSDPTMGSYEFSTQYEMNPVPPEDQTFRPEWLERLGFFYTLEEIRGLNLSVNIYIDPANKRRKKSDYTAIMAIGVDHKGTKYLLDIIRDKLAVEARTNLAIEIAKKYNSHKIHYETIGFQDTDKYIIEKKGRETGYHISVEEITATSTSKEDRIRGLQPIYERGDVRWPKEYSYYSEFHKKRIDMIQALRDEMLMFPKCEHDDMLDVHSFMLKTFEVMGKKDKEVEPEDQFMAIRKHAIDNRHGKKEKFLGFGKKIKFRGIQARKAVI